MASAVEFPDCCGIIVLQKFKGGHPGSDPDDCLDAASCEELLRFNEREYYGKRACLMAVLSQPQEDKIGHVFRSRKWVLLKQINNCRTGVDLFMYMRDMNPTAARERRIFGG